jgi:hypothetical protein
MGSLAEWQDFSAMMAKLPFFLGRGGRDLWRLNLWHGRDGLH